LFLVIASQAIITGCFSLLSQAGSLGFCPPLYVHHTSEKVVGQIYVPVSFKIKKYLNKILILKRQ
jgi:KUP system potassium uptake protein